MCGILGIYSLDGGASAADVSSGLAALHHRGPDGRGSWIDPSGRIALGHTRLRIIGGENGRQPLHNEDGSISAVVNGEFYDFERIRSDLERRGHRFQTRSDSEILVHLYEEKGAACLEDLRGEFAFLLWDDRYRRLFAGRDRFGIKPLVYTRFQNRILLASEAKALFAMGPAPGWDEASFLQAAHFQYLLPEQSLFRGVRQVRPGHLLRIHQDVVEERPYWDLDYRQTGNPSNDHSETPIQDFRDALKEAVTHRLRADVPVCCHLSGGLDSSTVAALVKRVRGTPPTCFTIGFSDADYDETSLARQTAAALEAPLTVIPVTQRDLLERLPDAVYYSEGLAINGHLSAKFLLSRAIREAGFKVALTGEGSDEVLAGYPHFRLDWLRHHAMGTDMEHRLLDANPASRGIMLTQSAGWPLAMTRRTLGFVPAFLEAKAAMGYRLREFLRDDLQDRHPVTTFEANLLQSFDLQGQLADRHPVDQSSYLWSKTALAQYILKTLGDGAEMAHSVEGRLPFLDHVLFDVLRRLPLDWKIHPNRVGGTTDLIEKHILRESMHPHLTAEVYARRKHPFMAPPLWRDPSDRAHEIVQDRLRSQACRDLPFFDHAKVRRFLDRLPHRRFEPGSGRDPLLMTLLSATALQERFFRK
ncbi:asparagine synthase (glutamine-hydrolyzing) [Sulfidibacter corallicola]|uniref:asparagine synthase (glutamine-hydrolyzing) n=1 Tax=Sulfidibacter corallicola TaxID=2818388 RepID=A0A8A4TNI3_SULCO|nr:asparagine synthase (glutamine-hydrolyzing) [Sulfidibacter corallicola]QTD51526.1 asparagine synthase (glutamine-hydrolyzing) [Sulfidibacter corallicola]